MIVATGAHRLGARSGLLAGLLFLVVTGFLAMHGFGWHVVPSHDAGGAGRVVVSHNANGSAVSDGPIVRSGTAMSGAVMSKASSAVAHVGGGEEEPGETTIVALCVAALSALVLFVLLATVRRGGEIPLRLWTRPLPPPRPRGRDPDPPSLAQLSVLRR